MAVGFTSNALVDVCLPFIDPTKQTLDPGKQAQAATMKVNDRYAAAMCRVDKWGRESFSWRNKMDGATKGIEVTAIDLAERFVGISEVTWTAFNPQILAMLTARCFFSPALDSPCCLRLMGLFDRACRSPDYSANALLARDFAACWFLRRPSDLEGFLARALKSARIKPSASSQSSASWPGIQPRCSYS